MLSLSRWFVRRPLTRRPVSLRGFVQLEDIALPAQIFAHGPLVVTAENRAGIVEAPAAVYSGGQFLGHFNAIEGYEQVPNTSSFPQRWVALVNTYFRQTYPTTGGNTAPFGTSIINSISYRTNGQFNLIPVITRMDVDFVNQETVIRYSGSFGTEVTETITLRVPRFQSEASASVSIEFTVNTPMTLSGSLLGKDALRAATISTMYVNHQQNDSRDVLFTDRDQVNQRLAIGDTMPHQHFFASPWRISNTQPHYATIKQPGSTWFPESPSAKVRWKDGSILIPEQAPIAIHGGLQGYRIDSTDPNDDSVSLWLEFLNTPNILPAGTTINVSYDVAVEAPRMLGTLLSPPAPLSPNSTTTDSTPTLLWSEVIGANQYEYQLLNSRGTIVKQGVTAEPFVHLIDVLRVGKYQFRVRTYNNTSEAGAWSIFRAFQIVLPAPMLTAPTGVLADRTPTLEYSSLVDGVTYEVIINRGSVRMLYVKQINDLSYTVPKVLPQGLYRANVRVRNILGELSAWSKPVTFRIDIPTPATPIPNGPVGITDSVNPTFTWNSVPFAARYDLRIDNLTTRQNNWLTRRVEGTSWTRDFPFAPQRYRWWIRAVNEVHEASAWVSGGEFTIQGDVLADLAGAKHWITYAPRFYNPDINQFPTETQIRNDLKQLYAEGWRGLITWTMDGTLREVARIAKEIGFSYVVSGIYYYDASQLAREYAAAIEEQSLIDAFIVGNEGLQFGPRYSVAQLSQVMADLKAATNKPVGTCETGGYLLAHPELLSLGDFVTANIHPWYAGIRNIADAVMHTVNEYSALQSLMPAGKMLYLRESWWPTTSDPVATPANQVSYFKQLAAHAIPFAFGEAYDQPFKQVHGEPLWGFHTNKGVKKPVVTQLASIYRDPR